MNKEKQDELCKKYPVILSRCEKPGSPMLWGIAVGDGWIDLLDDTLRIIQHRMAKNKHVEEVIGKTKQLVAVQIKEKFGGLRFYYEGGDNYIRGVIDAAEVHSYRICEECGEKGKMRNHNYMNIRCDACDKKWLERLKKDEA